MLFYNVYYDIELNLSKVIGNKLDTMYRLGVLFYR